MDEVVRDFIKGILKWIAENPYEAAFGVALFVLGIIIPLILGLPQKAVLSLVHRLSARKNRLRDALKGFGTSVELIDKHKLAHPASPQRIQQFYAGGALAWDIIAVGADIQRDKQEELLSALRAMERTLRIICLVGGPGAGKSTAAWRAATEIYRQKRGPVLWVKRSDDPEVWFHLPEFCSVARQHVFVLVDDLFRHKEVIQALRKLDPSVPLTILATSQTAEYHPHRLPCAPLSVPLEVPSDDEKTRMLSKLGKSRDDLTPNEQSRLDGATDFRILMMELTSGKGHEEAISETVRRLEQVDPIGYDGYKYVSFCYRYGIPVPISVVERLSPQGRFHHLDQRPAVQGLILQDPAHSGYLRAGHSSTAATAFNAYFQAPNTVLSELIRTVDEAEQEHRLFVTNLLHGILSTEKGAYHDKMLLDIAPRLSSLASHASGISETFYWSNCLEGLGMVKEAEASLKTLIRTAPTNSWECNMLLHVLRKLDREREALPYFLTFVQSSAETRGMRIPLLFLVKRYGTPNQIDDAILSTRQWLAKHLDVSDVRAVLLGMVEQFIPEMMLEVIEETRKWLANHSDESNVRATLLGLIERHAPDMVPQVIKDTRKWLTEHPNVTNVRSVFLGLVERQAPKMVPQVIEDTQKWLVEHSDARDVRVALLGLAARQAPDTLPQMIEDTRKWLAEHSDVRDVRAALLGLVERHAPDMVPQMIEDTRKWLAEYSDVRDVRTALLGLVERHAPDVAPQVIEDTQKWLAEHSDVCDVRVALLELVERHTPNMVPQMIEDTRKWLAEHSDVRDVRTALLKVVERCAPNMVPQVIEDTRQWLAEHVDADDVRLAFFGLVERLGLEGEHDKVSDYVRNIFADWQEQEQEEEASWRLFGVVIGNKRLEDIFEMQLCKAVDEYGVVPLVKSRYSHQPWLVWFANWLRDHEYAEQARYLYEYVLNLNPAQTTKVILQQVLYGYARLQFQLAKFAKAARLFKRTLEIHKGHIAAHVGLADAFQKLGNEAYQRRKLGARNKCFEKAKEELRHAADWSSINKQPVGSIYGKLGWLFLSWGKYEEALKVFKDANQQPEGEHFANYWGQGRALMALGHREEAEAALRKSLAIAPEELTLPAKDEITELLQECRG